MTREPGTRRHPPSALTRDQVRSVDRWAIETLGLPAIALMENAGRGAAESLLRNHIRGPVCVVAGGGNNGGDGYVIARHLAIAGLEVEVLSLVPPEKLAGDAEINAKVASKLNISIRTPSLPGELALFRERLDRAEWIVDALLGTGLTSDVRSPYAEAIRAINESEARVLAVDVPSGLDCDTGLPLGIAVQADRTVTFVALKPGFLKPAASRWLGEVEVVGIGVPIPSEFAH
jgi:NAD(P)H-hydrate epimerase